METQGSSFVPDGVIPIELSSESDRDVNDPLLRGSKAPYRDHGWARCDEAKSMLCNEYGSETPDITGYVDSDYAGDSDTKRSQTGYVFCLNSCTINWKANLQTIVVLSTIEVEYIACTKAVKEALWLKGMATDFGLNQRQIHVHSDNQSALHLSKNQMFHERTKHIDVRLYFIRELIAYGKIKLDKISTAENPSDMLTKAVTTTKFKHCLKLLGKLG
uniref:Retrovirus-related Pol polyprotein from transposon TNT 1-94 n=1 Tax=Cannabis sativa TaxID=3483 RepID=A0A803PQR2_CANSA